MTDNKTPNEDTVRREVQAVIDRYMDEMYSGFDQLHKRGIHDNDVINALRYMGEDDMVDGYAEWAEIDLRTDDNTTTNPVVPDPADAPSYDALNEHLQNLAAFRGGVREADLVKMQAALPKGSRVRYWTLARTPESTAYEGVTSSEVGVMASTPVVSVENYPGRIALTHIERLPND